MASKQDNPFADFDPMKMMSEFQIPGMDSSSLIQAQQRNLEAIGKANQTAIACMQTVARRQAEILRETMDESTAMMKELSAEGAPEEKLAKHADLVRETFEKALGHMRELSDTVTKANSEATDILTQRMSESLAELKGEIEKLKK